MVEKLIILNDLDQETGLQLIESAVKYTENKESVPLHKLPLNFRIPFSILCDFFKKSLFIRAPKLLIKDLPAQIKDPGFVSLISKKLIQLHDQLFNRVRLLELGKSGDDDRADDAFFLKRIDGSNGQKDMLIFGRLTQLIGESGGLESFQWRINVLLSNTLLKKILRPEIVFKFTFCNGKECSFIVNMEQFEEIRRNIALVLRHLHILECSTLLNR